ncbi:uncharacterized protein BP01DRAFT_355419 [Aspergillus saccharolyticus JOP 1030-1]|uniref:Uncharacterized protein n=1 Tax=Aspergillus saccharolyticus JOP 1030-1 TaxID=1450539 RepID=A0A318ZHG8_9EURO|nr:hypothetical protein BP01DRAFT_355419 [Aspergillus saccharolyticus JOP 1030-1]PYH46385.1 hypothetical protein BP01DRAFT_355419 [Aspergillus saccharolyticus JOP 1030-1]
MTSPTEGLIEVSSDYSTPEPIFNDTASTLTIPISSPREGSGLSPLEQTAECVDEYDHGDKIDTTDNTISEPLEAVEPFGCMSNDTSCHSAGNIIRIVFSSREGLDGRKEFLVFRLDWISEEELQAIPQLNDHYTRVSSYAKRARSASVSSRESMSKKPRSC